MKISKIFHSLYFMVMFLPLFIIPIFAININQKSVEPISVEVQEHVQVDFNQLYNENRSSYSLNGVTITNNNDNSFTLNGTMGTSSTGYTDISLNHHGIEYITNHIYLFGSKQQYEGIRLFIINTGNWNTGYPFGRATSIGYNLNYAVFNIRVDEGTYFEDFVIYPQIYDLTQMFGEGNEPTIDEFNSMFSNSYYEYTESEKMLVDKPTLTTYDNTDIGSLFIYSLYKPVHDYFNFGQYFGLNGIYDWFQVNFFNGTAPLPFFIFFNLMIYWLIISLFWLIFDVLIYVPMVIHRWLDKGALE